MVYNLTNFLSDLSNKRVTISEKINIRNYALEKYNINEFTSNFDRALQKVLENNENCSSRI